VSFRSLVRRRSKGFIIATFLAVLELTRQHYLHLELSDDAESFALQEREEKPLQPDDPALGLDEADATVTNGRSASD
jgi:segregation and condensation protein A